MATWDRTYSLLGMAFRVRCEHADVADHLQGVLESLESPGAAVSAGGEFSIRAAGGVFELLRGPDCIRRSPDWADLVRFMLAETNRAALANYEGFACHAGVVAAGRRALAFPAGSHAGKSTLTCACVLAGFDYVSDEALCLGFEDGEVTPYPRPLELSAWSRERLRIRVHAPARAAGDDAFVGVGEIGGRVAAGALELAHLVVFEIAAGPPALTPLPRSRVVTNLIGHSFNHYKHPLRSFRLAARVAQECRAWRLCYDSATDAAELLRSRLAAG